MAGVITVEPGVGVDPGMGAEPGGGAEAGVGVGGVPGLGVAGGVGVPVRDAWGCGEGAAKPAWGTAAMRCDGSDSPARLIAATVNECSIPLLRFGTSTLWLSAGT